MRALTPALDLHVIGIGKERARNSIKRLLASRQWSDQDGILLLGFAGGLDPALQSGDLVLASRYYRIERQDFREPDGNMWRQAVEAASEVGLTVCLGNSLTADRVIAAPEAKKAAWRQYQAVAVNMEDYWVAEAAAEAGAPFLSARAALDTASQGLPSYLLEPSTRPAQVARRTLIKPWRVPTLLRLAGQMKAAQGSLTRFALAFVDHQLPARDRQ